MVLVPLAVVALVAVVVVALTVADAAQLALVLRRLPQEALLELPKVEVAVNEETVALVAALAIQPADAPTSPRRSSTA